MTASGTEQTTYRYLRAALLALLLALAVSVAVETLRRGWETSLSSYYYTAAGPVFVGVLTSVGVCLIALRGGTDAEDVCLNLAGISAPMVAFVPTPEEGQAPDVHAIANNAATFWTVLAVGYAVVLVRGLRRRARGESWPSPWGAVGLVSTAAAWVVGVIWIALDEESFAAHAHALAAVFTFLPFAGVVVLNTDWGVRVVAGGPASRTRYDAAYWGIAGGMALVAVVFAALWAWDYALLGVEIGELALFAVFWVLQSLDLMKAAETSLE
ncbi:hypothetical protein AB3X52_00660 [Nocardioides sp. DS6]|uniref:DUF998 domain-containing protein n=1 Tax=Nocardioides eburneus TaxID=3231482 RepID=A0ABV3ST54_9ACTN